jgi:hypothetical protein
VCKRRRRDPRRASQRTSRPSALPQLCLQLLLPPRLRRRMLQSPRRRRPRLRHRHHQYAMQESAISTADPPVLVTQVNLFAAFVSRTQRMVAHVLIISLTRRLASSTSTMIGVLLREERRFFLWLLFLVLKRHHRSCVKCVGSRYHYLLRTLQWLSTLHAIDIKIDFALNKS